jgi:hypothetical protein
MACLLMTETAKTDNDEPIREVATIVRGDRSLSGKQVHAIVARRLRRIEKLNFLESFAMFMGKAQLIELGLKNILADKYGYDEERIESWPLGRVVKSLRESGLRQDFVHLVEELKEHRNYIAHELLANDALLRRLAGGGTRRIAWKSLGRGLYSVEEAIVVHDFLFGGTSPHPRRSRPKQRHDQAN